MFKRVFITGIGGFLGSHVADEFLLLGYEVSGNDNLIGGLPTRVYSHKKGIMVEKLMQIHGFDSKKIFSVGDSSTDLSMKIGKSKFIGFNPVRERAILEFEKASVPIVFEKDLREIWPIIFGEKF